MTGRLDGRTCVITGAGRGIGAAIAARLGEEGANVVIADVDGDAAAAVAAAIPDGRGLGVACDVSDRDQVRAAITAAVERFGRIDVFYNNAGVSQTVRFMDVTEAEWDRTMRVNGLGVLVGTQEAARQLIAQGGGGKIINTASIAGKQGYPLFPNYSASKFAVVGLTQSAARALAEHGITVNAFCPGVVGTELWQQLDQEFQDLGETERPGQALEEFGASILLGRVSTPKDVVGLAVFLATADADYITGQSIQVDGGMVLQ